MKHRTQLLIDSHGRILRDLRVSVTDRCNFRCLYCLPETEAAEKFYRTVSEEFATARPSFRWRHLIALARVTASESGRPAPGMAEARALLNV